MLAPLLLPFADDFSPSPAPFLIVLFLGFLVGIAGHITKSKTAVAIGIGLIFLATVLIPLLLYGNPY